MADITIIKGYARRTDAGIQTQLRQFSGESDADFLTLYFDLGVDADGGTTTKKVIHFEKQKGVIYQSLGTVTGSDRNDRTQLADCRFFSNAFFYYTDKQGKLQSEFFSKIKNVPDFAKSTINSSDSKKTGHSRTRFSSKP